MFEELNLIKKMKEQYHNQIPNRLKGQTQATLTKIPGSNIVPDFSSNLPDSQKLAITEPKNILKTYYLVIRLITFNQMIGFTNINNL